MEEDRKNWASIVRSCVLSSKVPLSPYQVNKDAKVLEGKNIPYKRLNYNSLEEMLKNIEGLKVFRKNGKTLVKAIASDETAHIQKMIQLQKDSKKSKRRLQMPPPTFDNKWSKTYYEPVITKKEAEEEPSHRQRNQQTRCHASSSTHSVRSRSPSPTPVFQNVFIMPTVIRHLRLFTHGLG